MLSAHAHLTTKSFLHRGKSCTCLRLASARTQELRMGIFANHGCDPGFTTRRQGRPVMGAMPCLTGNLMKYLRHGN